MCRQVAFPAGHSLLRPTVMTHLRAVSLLLMAVACGPRPEAPDVPGRDYLYLWTASADTTQPDFLAVLDVTEDSVRYGRLVTTLPVPGLANSPHHTEHELPSDRQLFANGFGSGKSFVFDLSKPATPRIAAQFGEVDGYAHPHSFLRLVGGNVLATFQMRHTNGKMRAGGLVEMTPAGVRLRSSSADTPGAEPGLRVYSAGIVPALDRIVTTSTDMDDGPEEPSRTLQVWRLSDLSLLRSITLQGPNGTLSAEPRLLDDGRTLLVSTFSCGLFLVDSLDTDAPHATQVGAFPRKEGTSCAIPAIVGHFYLVTVPAWSAVVSLDISNPRAPREVSRVAFDATDVPHWLSVSPDHRRVVVTGYKSMQNTVQILRFDAQSGQLTLDTRFREEGASRPGYRMVNKQWPHGSSADGIPHGAVFSRRDTR
jgi:hypothetical protein